MLCDRRFPDGIGISFDRRKDDVDRGAAESALNDFQATIRPDKESALVPMREWEQFTLRADKLPF